jgi:hypothetical protein
MHNAPTSAIIRRGWLIKSLSRINETSTQDHKSQKFVKKKDHKAKGKQGKEAIQLIAQDLVSKKLRDLSPPMDIFA